MIRITAFELVSRESGFHILFQGMQQLVDGQHRIVLGVTGVGCGHFLVPDKQQRVRRMHGEARVQDVCQLLALQLRKCGTTDLGTVEQGFVGRHADGIQIATHAKSQTEVFSRVRHSFIAGTFHEFVGIAIQGGSHIQRLNVQFADLTAAPYALLGQPLVMAEHFGVG